MSIAKRWCIGLAVAYCCATAVVAMPVWYFDAAYLLAGSSQRLWTPSNITTIAWYDASLASTITATNGTNVSIWADISGAGQSVTQNTATARFSTGVRTINGLNVLDGDGGDYLSRANLTIPTNGNVTFFALVSLDVINNTFDTIFSTNGTRDFGYPAVSNTTWWGRIVGAGIGGTTSNTNGPFMGTRLHELKFDKTVAGNYSVSIDGYQRATNTAYTNTITTPTLFRIFATRPADNFPDGAVAEVVLIEDCTLPTRQKMQGYLAHKWGISTNLPPDHPYYSTPPKQ